MATIFYAILKTARPRQWLKNLAVFTTLIFTGQALSSQFLIPTIWAAIAFCLLSSSNYIINDIIDAPSDRRHPFKKFRPVASGKLSIPIGFLASVCFILTGLYISFHLGSNFFLIALLFITIQYTYSLILKKISVIDILTITTGYILRIYAGEAVTGYHISIWLSLTALSLALFLAVGKRRSELTLIQKYRSVVPKDTRVTLSHYSEKLLDTYTAMFANSTFITYSFYTFLERPVKEGYFFHGYGEYLYEFTGRKWLMLTIPMVLFGIMRYMQLIYEGQGESPEKILTSDKPLLFTIGVWALLVFTVIYGIGG